MTEDLPTSTPGPAAINPAAAMGQVLVRPGETFGRLVPRPTWWLPFVVGLILAAIFSTVMTSRVDFQASMQQKLEQRAEKTGQKIQQAQVDAAAEMQQRIAPFYPFFGAFGYAFFFFLAALVLWGGARVFGSEAKFAMLLAVFAYASVPNLIKSVVANIHLLAKPDSSLLLDQLGKLVPTNLGALLGPQANPVLLALLSSFDIFTIAVVILLIAGFRKLPGLSRGYATAIPLVLWGLLIVLSMGRAAFFG